MITISIMKTRATGVLMHENKILMIHRFRDGNEYYVLPGGGVEYGEEPKDAVLREIKEETSIEAKLKYEPDVFSHKYTSDTGEESTHRLFLCEYISGIPKLSDDSVEKIRTTTNNIYEPMWVEVDKLDSMIIWPMETKEWLLLYLKL